MCTPSYNSVSVLHLSLLCARMRAYGLSDRCLGKLLATGESVYVPKVLTGTQCADHAESLARGKGGKEEVQREGWEKGRWSGGSGGLSWRNDTY